MNKYKQWRFSRRKRLVRKWDMTREFRNVSVSERFECDLVSRLPNDQEWHHLAIGFEGWMKRNKEGKPTKMAQISLWKDGELDGQWVMNGSFVQPEVAEVSSTTKHPSERSTSQGTSPSITQERNHSA